MENATIKQIETAAKSSIWQCNECEGTFSLDDKSTTIDEFVLCDKCNKKMIERNKHNYMMLDRLKQDCEYWLGNGGRYNKDLWAGTPEKQIKEMKRLYKLLPEKPEWLTYQQIEGYENKMV